MIRLVTKGCCILLLVLLANCRQSGIDQYHALLKKEQESKKKVNDIFFGIALGMASKDFYMHCWDLNKQGVFTDGAGNTAVNYKLTHNELKHPADMNFYPEFHKDKISSLWAKFQYAGWMPWNKKMDSDNLLADVVQLYKKWYPAGNPFIAISDKEKGTIYVKVDGNRRIIIGRFDDVQVKADYTDLSVEPELKKQNGIEKQ
jgi:hypothetical protein